MPRKPLYLILFGAGTVILDQITKMMVQKNFELHESVVILEGFFSFTYILNPGAAFGFFADQSAAFRAIFFLTISIIALTMLFIFFRQTPEDDRLGLMAISLLFGGAIGNLIDRIRLGEVVDFLDVYVGRYHWPAFNVADSSITVGISLLMIHLLLQKNEATGEDLKTEKKGKGSA